jgi:hypothetical protein
VTIDGLHQSGLVGFPRRLTSRTTNDRIGRQFFDDADRAVIDAVQTVADS